MQAFYEEVEEGKEEEEDEDEDEEEEGGEERADKDIVKLQFLKV